MSNPAERENEKSASLCEFVRSQDHLAVAKPAATGRRMTRREVVEAFGESIIDEVFVCGSAILAASKDEPARTFSLRREKLGLSRKDVSKATKLSIDAVADAENPTKRSPIRDLESIAIALGLDERLISTKPGAGGDDHLAARLREISGKKSQTQEASAALVRTLAEAAWVIMVQDRLGRSLGKSSAVLKAFKKDGDYGGTGVPTWKRGYELAARARRILGLSEHEPVPSLRKLCGELGIPLLYGAMPQRVAGATVASNGSRGIVVNTVGPNENIWMRRATIAHELGHLLWDPENKLDRVRVDEYAEVEQDKAKDWVETRANAFAIAFIAPPSGVTEVFRQSGGGSGGTRAVMAHFGMSFTASINHIRNVLGFSAQQSVNSAEVDKNPTEDWRGRESFTDDFFPISGLSHLRRGEFSGFVVQSQKSGMISKDTAASYLQTSIETYEEKADAIEGLF